jgi:WD40 repeat protein
MIRDAETGATLAILADGVTEIASLTWLDANRVITGDDQGRARVWDIPGKRIVRTLTQKGAIYGIVVSTVEPRWVATFGDSTTVSVFDLESGAPRATLPGHSIGVDIAESPCSPIAWSRMAMAASGSGASHRTAVFSAQ